MSSTEIVIVAALVVAHALVSKRAAERSVTMPMVFVGAGWLLGAVGAVEISIERETLALIAEITLAVILFGDAVRVDPRRLRRHLAMPTRLLLIGLPLTIASGTVINLVVLDAVTLAQAALLAAILAPTDAALGAAVVEDESVPARERLTLNVESGVNDGLVVPAVAVFTAIVIDENRGGGEWGLFVLEQIGFGIAIGVVVGALGIRALCFTHVRGWSDGRYEQLATFVLPLVALFAAEALEGNSFIAAFVAGLCFGAGGSSATNEHGEGRAQFFAEFTEDAAQLLAAIAFFLFGNVFVDDAVEAIDWRVVVAAVACLTVVRMLPVWISLVGTATALPTRLFLGWFGPRGLASIVFALVLLEDVGALGDAAGEIYATISLTVIVSVVAHGASAAPGARRYARWAADEMAPTPEDDMADELPPTRWS